MVCIRFRIPDHSYSSVIAVDSTFTMNTGSIIFIDFSNQKKYKITEVVSSTLNKRYDRTREGIIELVMGFLD